ncbi:394_t:CDS:2 [Acaulospora morrowiae]|uniref:394_t:CDS:1 n=1 Tax=Acaulospora morrowiae TaxID=94023 RepID=A0A9N9CYL5_9GLOM|nr:394_t:CDS:2 [Acaulospora morrowiae]
MIISLVVIAIVGYYTYKWILYPLYISPLCKIPGPPPDHFLLGNFVKIFKEEVGHPQIKWTIDYGGVLCYRSLFNRPRVFITDPKALQHVLSTNVYDYPKPKMAFVSSVVGNGILMAEGEVHRRQRKMMNPIFSYSNVKEMIPSFAKVAHTLKDIWIEKLNNREDIIDIVPYLSQATLDVIGIVGFNYQFNSLTTTNELATAYEMVFHPKNRENLIIRILSNNFPMFEKLPIKSNIQKKEALKIIHNVSENLVRERLEEAKRGELQGTDLLTMLVKINEQAEEKMSFDELKNQIMTFLAAGHETTSVATGWALYYLSKDQESQSLLREELMEEFPDKNFVPTFDQINDLEYLNAVVKETLRIVPPVPIVVRKPKKDDVINGYVIPKGTPVFISPNTVHRLPSIWGQDADDFKPSRWLIDSSFVITAPDTSMGSFSDSNLVDDKPVTNYTWMPFITGTRNCIGGKLALNEMKVLLAVLIRNFRFREIEGFEVKRKMSITLRPDPTIKLWVEEMEN